jgi:two-component system, sensor histidine kinase ChiS
MKKPISIPFHQFRVLLLESDEQSRTTLAHVLERHHYQVKTADNTEEALALLEKKAFDVIILTDMLAVSPDNIRVLQTARKQEYPPALIFMTSSASAETIIAAFRVGVNDCILKPYNHPELLERVRVVLEHRNREILQLYTMREIYQIASGFLPLPHNLLL